MRNLAIECASMSPSVGVFDGESLIAFRQIDRALGSMRMLAPSILEILPKKDGSNSGHSGVKPVDMISLTIGPGSFTSLRIGLATAKSLSLAWDVPLLGLDTLQVLAYQTMRHSAHVSATESCMIVPVWNAYRKEVFTAFWKCEGQQELTCLQKSCVRTASDWWQDPALSQTSADLIIGVGMGLEAYPPTSGDAPRSRRDFQFAERELWEPRLDAIAQLGASRLEQGGCATAVELVPNYVRGSAAEEKLKFN